MDPDNTRQVKANTTVLSSEAHRSSDSDHRMWVFKQSGRSGKISFRRVSERDCKSNCKWNRILSERLECSIINLMETIIKKVENEQLNNEVIIEAGEILKRGGLVAFPTETVYGLGADALNEEAAQKIYAAKGRPSDNPLIVHITNMEDLLKITKNVSKEAFKVA